MKENGHPNAERSRCGWSDDRGDIDGVEDLTIEIKNQKKISLGDWISEMEQERINRKTKYGVVIAKKKLSTSVDDWYAVMPASLFIKLFNDLKEIS